MSMSLTSFRRTEAAKYIMPSFQPSTAVSLFQPPTSFCQRQEQDLAFASASLCPLPHLCDSNAGGKMGTGEECKEAAWTRSLVLV